ncbi:MFS transporter [Streptantibioticus silvisoli]|uniref:MFS transporter n=1 Tax=Streptantibioticus silvisoli TaxID=2705255 RepID=A0ABT6VW46_9ACTN|nr:MFS transporter [Streptantibioticus silvisoli]MDI5962365.1 MFS transporter [Streptantibioticus silvisoli]
MQASYQVLLRDAGFRCCFAARVLSRGGDVVFPIGLTGAMLANGYGTTQVGIVLGSSMVPAVLLMLMGGVLSDRFPVRRLMISADTVRFLAEGVLVVLFFCGQPSLVVMTLLTLVCGAAQAFFQPGLATLIRHLVPGRLREGNALIRTGESVMTFASPAVAAVIIVLTGPVLVIALDAVTFGLSALLLSRIRITGRARPETRPGVWKELAHGWQEFSSRPWLCSVIVVFALFGLLVFGPFDVLKAVVLTRRFGASAYALVVAAQGLGSLAGGLLALHSDPGRPLRTGAAMLLSFATVPAVIALGAPFWLVAAAMLLGGIGLAFWSVMWSTAVQTHSPVEAMSRISAYDVVGSTGFTPIGRALSGPAVALAGTTAVLLGGAVLTVAGCLVLLALPAVARLRSTENQVPNRPLRKTVSSSDGRGL